MHMFSAIATFVILKNGKVSSSVDIYAFYVRHLRLHRAKKISSNDELEHSLRFSKEYFNVAHSFPSSLDISRITDALFATSNSIWVNSITFALTSDR